MSSIDAKLRVEAASFAVSNLLFLIAIAFVDTSCVYVVVIFLCRSVHSLLLFSIVDDSASCILVANELMYPSYFCCVSCLKVNRVVHCSIVD